MRALRTDRLLLRPVTMDDAPALQRHFAHWDIIRNMTLNVPWPYPDDGAETFLREHVLPGMADGSVMAWAIVPDEASEPVGLLEYRVGAEKDDNRGFWIGTAYQGKGYMTEAVTAFQDYLFFELGVERIFVVNAVNNPESRRVKQKTGAVLHDHPEVLHHSGETRCERWIITREAWTALRGDQGANNATNGS